MRTTFVHIFVIFLLSCQPSSQIGTIVSTKQGKIEGVLEGNIHTFKGIPFAKPPLDDLRWKAPQEMEEWTETLECKAFGPSPMQSSPVPFMYWSKEFLIPETPISEDCLYLNVWTAAKKPMDKLPVFVYIYGGGFRSGGTACPIYDGTAMAGKGVIFVSLNYRLGVFGFFAHPELSAEAAYGTSGNYALLDMMAGLKWVQENISSFGGDPENVTIAGQSAGAFAVNYLVASPLAKGLFHKAIAQSGGSVYSNPLRPSIDLKAAESNGQKFANNLDSADLVKLRQMPAEYLLKAIGGLSSPIIDGHVMPQSINQIFISGKQNDVPTMVGWNKEDRVGGPPQSADSFKQYIVNRFGPLAETFLAAYPAQNNSIAARSQIEMGRDEVFGAQNFGWASMQLQSGTAQVFVYNFDRQVPFYDESTNFGAFHSGEIVYAYDNLQTLDRPWKDSDKKLAKTMSFYWANFAKTGNPNGKDLAQWPVFTNENKEIMYLDEVSKAQVCRDLDKMAAWKKYFEQE